MKVGMRMALAFAGSLVGFVCLGQEGGNLLMTDFLDDHAGGFLGWSVNGASVTHHIEGGLSYLRFVDTGDGFSLSHDKRKLVPGERYRIRAKVRTHGLVGPRRVQLMIHGWPWDWEGRVDIPRETHGVWQEVKWEGPLTPSEGDLYDCTLYCSDALQDGAYLDFAEPRLEAVSERGARGASPLPNVRPFSARISPVEPVLADVDPDEATIRFYYPGPVVDDAGRRSLAAECGGRRISVPFGNDHMARVEFGRIGTGRHVIRLSVVDATGARHANNEYAFYARPRVENPTSGCRLNNFVTELFRRPIADGSCEFVLAKEGWVYIGLDGAPSTATVDVDDETDAVRFRPFERMEAMRDLSAGKHALRVKGIGGDARNSRIVVRLVKPIIGCAFDKSVVTRFMRTAYRFDRDYYARFGPYGAFNTQSVTRHYSDDRGAQEVIADLKERGQTLLYELNLARGNALRDDLAKYSSFIVDDRYFRAGQAVILDENAIGADALKKFNSTEALWRAYESGVRVDTCLEDGSYALFTRKGLDIPELAAYVNVGNGRSYLSSEAYFRSPEDAADYRYALGFMRRQIRGMRELVPSAPSRMVYLFGGWMTIGSWTSWCHPYVDMKAYYAKMLHMLATDDEFRDVGGVGFSTPWCDEDVFRFMAAAFRHYCIEGRTDDLCDRLGYSVFAPSVRNGDFRDGFDGWIARPATDGSLSVERLRLFGLRGQQRRFANRRGVESMHFGEDFAVFRPVTNGVSTLTQRICGLKPGGLYQVTYATMDYEALFGSRSDSEVTDLDIVADFTGGIEFADLRKFKSMRGKKAGTDIRYHRQVFRATTDELTVVFSDRAARRPVALNYIGCRPFFVRDARDLDSLCEWERIAR